MSSAPKESVEERLAHLEKEVLRLKAHKQISQSKDNWISDIVGTAADDPDYEEILRLGKEARDAQQPGE